jgi:hypothetical protein
MNRWKRRRKPRGKKIKASKVVYQKNVPAPPRHMETVFAGRMDRDTGRPVMQGMRGPGAPGVKGLYPYQLDARYGVDYAELEARALAAWAESPAGREEVTKLNLSQKQHAYSVGYAVQTVEEPSMRIVAEDEDSITIETFGLHFEDIDGNPISDDDLDVWLDDQPGKD